MLRLEDISARILIVRGRRVIVAADLAALYGVGTRVLNRAVQRHPRRFPADFAFRLRFEEREQVITICDHLRSLKFSPALPHRLRTGLAAQAPGQSSRISRRALPS
jgi:hypothetical protein